MQAITLEVILRTVLGPAEPRLLSAVRTLVNSVVPTADHGVHANAMNGIPGEKARQRARALRARLDDVLVAEIIQRRNACLRDRTDVLSLLLAAHNDHGPSLPDQELCDHLVTLLFAGHATTATALAWVFESVVRHQDVHDRLVQELRNAFGEGPVDTQRVDELRFLDATIKETLRLHPVFAVASRIVKRPLKVGHWEVPVGALVNPCIYLTHRRPELWSAPDEFRPDRFLDRSPSPHQYFPFGGGDRRCLGMHFAVYEMKLVLATALGRTRVRAASDRPARTQRHFITLAPDSGVPIVAEPLR